MYFYNEKTKTSIWDVAEVMKIAKSEKKVTFSPTVKCQSSTPMESLVTRRQVTWVEEMPPLGYDGYQQSQLADVIQVRSVNTGLPTAPIITFPS